MSFKIKTKDFMQALQMVLPGLASKEIVEQSTSFVFHSNKIITYNDMVSVRVDFPFPDTISVSVPAKEFYTLLTKVKDEFITIDCGDNYLHVTGDKFVTKIKINSNISISIDNIRIVADKWEKLPDNFIQGVEMCLMSAAKDSLNVTLSCICLCDVGIKACDNFRLMQYSFKSSPFTDNILIPCSSIKELIKYQPVSHQISSGWIHFQTQDGIVFSCRVYEAEYPDMSPILEMEEGEQLVFPTDMCEILDRARTLAEVDLVGDQIAIIEIQNGKMKVNSKSSVGEFEEKDRIRVQGHYKFECNIQFLQEILAHLRIAEMAKDGSKLKFIGDSFIHILALYKR